MPVFRARLDTVTPSERTGWSLVDERVLVWVPEMPDWRMCALAAVRELVEAILCRDQGYSAEDIAAWTLQFDEDMAHDRKVMEERLDELKSGRGEAPADEFEESDLEADLAAAPFEAADHPGAPHHDAAMAAREIERRLAAHLDIPAIDYLLAQDAQ